MLIAIAAFSAVLAAFLAFSAVRKLSHEAQVVQSYARVGVPEDKLDYLAILLLLGAAGLLLGLLWSPVGIAAAIGVIVYFVAAVVAHLRAGDPRRLVTPLSALVIAVITLALRVASN